jgi:hypothetical protein
MEAAAPTALTVWLWAWHSINTRLFIYDNYMIKI